MSLLLLLRQNLKHIVRSRLLLFLFLLSFMMQYLGVKFIHAIMIHYQDVVLIFGPRQTLFTALIFQVFTGAFLAAVYGIWMVPYAHQGARSQMTFTLPISKWMFPLSYGITMLGLLCLQYLVMMLSFVLNFGTDIFFQQFFSTRGLWLCLGLQTLAFEVLMFGFALAAMVLGQVPTFFFGATVFFLLQLMAAMLRVEVKFISSHMETFEKMRWLYYKMPPVGELVFDLRRIFLKDGPDEAGNVLLWCIWLLVFVALFRLKLRYPSRGTGIEAT